MPHSLVVHQLWIHTAIQKVFGIRFLEGKLPQKYYLISSVYIPHTNGVADYAPYGLRKVEAGLLRDGFKREEVVVAHPDHIEKFIGPHTEVVGTYEIKWVVFL